MILTPTTHLLKLPEAAAELRVGESTMGEWVFGTRTRDPVLASFTKDKVRRVSLEDLTRFVLLNTVNPKRPDWLTAAVESEFRRQLREMIQAEFNAEAQRRGEMERAA